MRLLPSSILLLTFALAGCATFGQLGQMGQSSSTEQAAPPRLDMPRAHRPPPGSCRIWVPGVDPSRQSAPGKCADLEQRVPAGAVLVHG
jgi:hypothetical protein